MSDIYKYDTDEILSPDEEVIHEQNKTIERLQEQLSEANYILKDVFISDAYYKSKRAQYLKKLGVK